jgi:glutamate--cysteine ligase
VTDLSADRLARLDAHRALLTHTLRGIEKEGLRVDTAGALARTPHSTTLGSALTHTRITTDYSEALLELITAPHHTVTALLRELEDTHRYVYATLEDEFIWNQSMPATLPDEADIPIAQYGSSNTGMFKHVYRHGLAERYGKTMQCIAGVHYNFSLDDRLWQLLEVPGKTKQERRSRGYIGLIRNFTRYSWLLMYLFGATPALSTDFLRHRKHTLQFLDAATLYRPYATSLRMSDLGYQNPAQSQLKLGYNELADFLQQLHTAVTTPWPAYQKLGTHRHDQWIQLNTNILQIENEYYATIRPKQTAHRDERLLLALAKRGVQYIEVRCLDVDPFEPIGIATHTSHFLDAFLLFCAASASPHFPKNGHCDRSASNFSRVVNTGRQPGLKLQRENKAVPLQQWGQELLSQILPYAQILDAAYGGHAYQQAVRLQADKLDDPAATPSGKLLAALQQTGTSFHEYTRAQSQQHAQFLRTPALSADKTAAYVAMTHDSWAQQKAIESSDKIDFETYVLRHQQALKTFDRAASNSGSSQGIKNRNHDDAMAEQHSYQ